MGLLSLFFILSILISFLCSIWEAVLLSITPSYISAKVQDKTPIGITLKEFKDDIDRPLSAVLTLNTIAHTVGAIGVGAQAAIVFGDSTSNLLGIPISGEAIVASLMTLAILILSEIIPKTLGANYWRRLTPFTVRSLQFLLVVLKPFIWVSQLITKNLKNDKDKSVFSKADLRAMAQVGEESGVLNTSESQTIKNLLRLDNITVKSIMTPRNVVTSATENMTLRDFYSKNTLLRFSRIPVFDNEKEQIVGILLKDDLHQALLSGKDDDALSQHIRPVVFISNEANLTELQNKLMKERSHIAVVVDDFGAILGLVTMEDLFETILGMEIVDESDHVEDLQKLARELWEKRASKMGLLEQNEEA